MAEMVDMKIWHPLKCTRVILLVSLVLTKEQWLNAPSKGVVGLHIRPSLADAEAITQRLMRLRESLRLTRSPASRAKFRPWGGKRSPSSRGLDYPLCSQLSLAMNPSLATKCYEPLTKRDKFRPWGGKRDANPFTLWPVQRQRMEYLCGEDCNRNNFQSSSNARFSADRGMPETVAMLGVEGQEDGDVVPLQDRQLQTTKWHQSLTKIQNNMKRAFEDRLRANAKKRLTKFNPWHGKRFFPENLVGETSSNSAEGAQLTGTSAESPEYGSNGENSVRTKRETSSEEDLLKRSVQMSMKDKEKQSESLSTILKTFGSINRGGTVRRGFHPWAGRKRSQDYPQNIKSKINYLPTGVSSWNSANENGKDYYDTVSRLDYDSSDPPNSFNSLAEKGRNLELMGLPKPFEDIIGVSNVIVPVEW